FNELGLQLERYYNALPSERRAAYLLERSADAYREGENPDGEIRVLQRMYPDMAQRLRNRYFDLLLARQPEKIIEYAGTCNANASRCDEAANYAVAHGDVALALLAVQSRGRDKPIVWHRAYTALAGFYLGSGLPQIQSAFKDLLGTQAIGELL